MTASCCYDCSFSHSFLGYQSLFWQDIFNILNIKCAIEFLLWFPSIIRLHKLIVIFTRLSLGVQWQGASRRLIGFTLPKLGFWRSDCSLHVWGDLLKETATFFMERVFLYHYVEVVLIWCWQIQTIRNAVSAQINGTTAPGRLQFPVIGILLELRLFLLFVDIIIPVFLRFYDARSYYCSCTNILVHHPVHVLTWNDPWHVFIRFFKNGMNALLQCFFRLRLNVWNVERLR